MDFTVKDIWPYTPNISDEDAIRVFTSFVYVFLQKIKNKQFIQEGILLLEVQAPQRLEHTSNGVGIKICYSVFVKGEDGDCSIFINDSSDPPVIFLITLPDMLGELFQLEIEEMDWQKYCW